MNKNIRWLLFTVITGILLANAHSLRPIFWVSWLAVIAFIYLSFKNLPHKAALLGLIAGFISSLSLFLYLLQLSNITVALLLTALRSLQYALFAYLFSQAFKHLNKYLLLLFVPALAAAVDLIMILFSPHGSGGSMAYSQMDFSPMVQLARFGGVPFIVFGLFLMGSLVAVLLIEKHLGLVVGLVVLVGLMFLNGQASGNVQEPTLRLNVMATDRFESSDADWDEVWSYYRETIESSENSYDIFILAEKLFELNEEDVGILLDEIQVLAKKVDAAVLIGVDEVHADAAYNRAYFVTADEVYSYDKIHMIPGYEDHFEVGSEPLVIDFRGHKIGVAICKDMDFPDTIRAYGDAEVDLMLEPAWDFYDDDWFHSRMAVMRGIENGFYIARSARRGLLNVSNPLGEIIVESSSTSDEMGMISAAVAPAFERTVYTRFGYLFGYLAVFIVVVGVLVIYKERINSNA
ncbi:carbon-nitrogen hydrolase family protein [Fundicoccus culcitae]|uniref:Carbon-nitrogen hydrolase family protein n=1 Tax=Fundicoccus culcitae TaxID=2969821 RepID=A0ABY5P835_9LACT|nr:carbon-nitrogen hydrolase family protein [Fundicoccus culcitae]UUX34750.1 carbon-nitrogen hydrolase family protein [Fundicoccus culcitae]